MRFKCPECEKYTEYSSTDASSIDTHYCKNCNWEWEVPGSDEENFKFYDKQNKLTEKELEGR